MVQLSALKQMNLRPNFFCLQLPPPHLTRQPSCLSSEFALSGIIQALPASSFSSPAFVDPPITSDPELYPRDPQNPVPGGLRAHPANNPLGL